MSYLTTSPVFDLYTFGQIFGIVVSFVGFFVYFGKKRSTLLFSKALLDFLYFLQQLMIGAYTGSVLNAIGVVRDIIFFLREKHKWASSRVWLYLFASLMFLSPVLTWMGPISLFPAVGSVLAVIGFYSLDPHRTRVFGLFAQSLWLIYCLYLMNIGIIITTTIQLVAVIAGLIRDYKEKRRATNLERMKNDENERNP